MKCLFLSAALCLANLAFAQQPAVDQFEIHPAFNLQRAAGEPLVQDPVDMEFDEQGRVFVLEMNGYPEAPENPEDFPGKIVILEDADKDGVFDRRIVFAEGFQYATSILPHRGGLLVTSPPDLLWLRDTDGDQRADERQVLMSGFSVGNSQHNVNGLIHGLDNWIYLGNGGNSGTVYWTDRPEEKFPIRHRDLRIHIESRRIDFLATTTTGFNVALDDWNHVFTTHNLRHVNHLVIPNRYFESSPYLEPPRTPDISAHKTKSLDRIYPIGAQESRVNHPEQSGFFSGACGITYYGGGAFPAEFEGNLFVADCVLNLVHRDLLTPAGASFEAHRARPNVEFLAGGDRASRPVNLTVGPDGALYVIDMYRRVIEHPEWIPDELENQEDIQADKDKGRIYRVFPKEGEPFPMPSFNRSALEKVVQHLEHANKWTRDTAQRLLVWWNDAESVPLLEELVEQSENPKARAHALRALAGMKAESIEGAAGRLSERLLLLGLEDEHPGVREQALLIAEENITDANAADRFQAIVASLEHPSPRVRMQAALSASAFPAPVQSAFADRLRQRLFEALETHLEDPWIRYAVLIAQENHGWEFLQQLARHPRLGVGAESVPDSLSEFLELLAGTVGIRENANGIVHRIHWLSARRNASPAWQIHVLKGLNDGFQRQSLALNSDQKSRANDALNHLSQTASPTLLVSVWEMRRTLGLGLPDDFEGRLETAKQKIRDASLSTSERLDYLRILSLSDVQKNQDFYFTLLDVSNPSALQIEAMRQLTRQANPALVERIIEAWPRLSRQTRGLAGDMLVYRSNYHTALLDALESGRILIGQLNMDLERRRRLLRSGDTAIRQRASRFFSDAGVVTRRQAIESMKPALALEGDAERGAVHFKNLCASCHTVAGEGFAAGPDLTEIHRKSAETLLHDILDPNAAVDEEYINFTVEDRNDDVHSGIVIQESDSSLTLRAANGFEETIPRTAIQSMTSMGLSLMPEGLEEGLSPRDMADLLAYLQQRR